MPFRCSSCICIVLAGFIFPFLNSETSIMFFSDFFYIASLPCEKGKSCSSLSHAASSTSHLPLLIFILGPLCWPSVISPSPSQPGFTFPFVTLNPVLGTLTHSAPTLRSHLELTATTSDAVSVNVQTSEIQLSSPASGRYSSLHSLDIPHGGEVWLQLCSLGLTPLEAWKAKFSFYSCAT